MKTDLLQLRLMHAEERKELLQLRQRERQELVAKHRERLHKSRLINADPISRSAVLLTNAEELSSFTFKYLLGWTKMEERHEHEISLLKAES